MTEPTKNETKNKGTEGFEAGDVYDFEEPTVLGLWQLDVAEGLLNWLACLKPSAALGIFGGWGAGKTALMYALSTAEQRHGSTLLPPIRAEQLTPELRRGGLNQAMMHLFESTGISNVQWGERRPLLLIDEIDKAPPECIAWVLTEVAAMQRIHKIAGQPKVESEGDSHRRIRIVLAGNLDRIISLLAETGGGRDDVDELVACAVGQRFYPTSPAPDLAVCSLWPLGGNRSAASNGGTALGTNFLVRYARQLPTANLRHLRQTIASLGYFSTTYGSAPYVQVRNQLGSDLTGDEQTGILRLLCQLALAIVVRVRVELPEVYREWTARAADLGPLLGMLRSLEAAFALAPAATLPEVEKSPEIGGALLVLRGSGFDVTADSVTQQGGTSLFRLYRDLRRELLRAWTAEVDVNALRESSQIRAQKWRVSNDKIYQTIDQYEKSVGTNAPATSLAVDSLEVVFSDRYDRVVRCYWEEFLTQ